MKPKKKFTPSWEIYNRILWDPKINQQAFYIGYEDRMIKDSCGEKMLVDWSGSDIPWSRVQYIRCEDCMIWHRIDRIDLFESNSLPKEAFAEKKAGLQNTLVIQGIQIVNKAVFGTNSIAAIPAVLPFVCDNLRILTFNVLTDKYDKALVQSSLRQPAIVAHLLAQQADILLLQEVDAPLLEGLRQANWGQTMYFSEMERTAEHYYQELLIVSKHPFSLMEVQFSKQKKFPIASWSVNGSNLHVANVHLTSNRAQGANEVRQAQLDIVTSYLDRLEGAVLVGGDFNTRGKEGFDVLQEQYIDAWPNLHSEDDGFTFEPNVNGLAKALTLTGLPARFDRIYLKNSPRNCWQLEQAVLFADEALKPDGSLFPSDHYGLLVTLSFQQVADVVIKESIWNERLATYHSGIVIIPPKSTWESIQNIRMQHDSKVHRWMPHITLLYGFVPDRYFERAAQELSVLMKDFNPFEIALKQYQLFVQKQTTTAWLEPVEKQNSNHLKDLQACLQAHFFMKNSKQKDLTRFTPHLSIGQFKSRAAALEQLPEWTSLDVEVHQIALISRHGEEPFKVRYTIDLGTGNIQSFEEHNPSERRLIDLIEQHQAVIDLAHRQRQNFVVDLLAEICTNLLRRPTVLSPLGSRALGSDTVGSDMDLLCAIPHGMNPLIFLENVLEELEGLHESARLVLDAQVPILKLTLEGLAVDLLCVQQANSFISISELQESHRHFFDAKSWQAISGVLEAQNLKQISQQHLSLDSFQWLVKSLKTWADLRAIKGNAFGFLGTYSWTVLACWACQRLDPKVDSEDLNLLLAHCFKTLADYTWLEPISVYKDPAYIVRGKQDRMPILTTIKPYYNSARNVTPSTARLLQKELGRAASLVKKIQKGKASWEQVFEAVQANEQHKIQLLLSATSSKQLEECCGWLEGHVVGLILGLEQLYGPYIRPYPSIKVKGLEATFDLGIELVDNFDAQALESCLSEFVASFGFDMKEGLLSYRFF